MCLLPISWKMYDSKWQRCLNMPVRDYKEEFPASRHGCSYLLKEAIRRADTLTPEPVRKLWTREKKNLPLPGVKL
jgi:hypothetical protein